MFPGTGLSFTGLKKFQKSTKLDFFALRPFVPSTESIKSGTSLHETFIPHNFRLEELLFMGAKSSQNENSNKCLCNGSNRSIHGRPISALKKVAVTSCCPANVNVPVKPGLTWKSCFGS